MVRKLLLCLALSMPLCAQAGTTFFWRMEGETLSGTDDKSAGDTTATANGGITISATAAKVGSNGGLTVNGSDYYAFDSASICDIAAGTVAGWIQFKTSIPTAGLGMPIKCISTANASEAGIELSSSQEARLVISSSGGTTINLNTSACNFAVNTWYFIVASWHIANDDRSIACYDSTGALISSNTDLSTDLAASAPSDFDKLRIGNLVSAHTDVIWVDNVFVSTSYGEAFQNFHGITSYVPTYTAGPTNGSFTSTTLAFTYTADQNGTTYAAACTNGQTVTSFANLKSGTCSGGAAVGTGTDTNSATVSDTVTITGLSAGTTYDVYIGQESTLGGQSAISSLADRATTGGAAPAFTSGPTVAATTNGFTISGTITCTGTCTVEAVACNPGDAAPTNAELEAGQCGGGNAAIMNAQENWATGVGDSFTMTASNKPVRFNVYVAGTDGSTDTNVITASNQNRSARAGFALVTIAGRSSTGICADAFASYFTPDCADGDTFEYEDDTNENANCNISFETDGDFVLTPVSAGDCDGRLSFEISYQDVSSATNGLFTSPANGNFTTDDTIYVNNSAPACTVAPEDSEVILLEDTAMTSIDLSVLGACTDADSDTLTYSITGGSLPTGTSLSGTGNKDWGGTPSTEDEAGTLITVTVTDIAGDVETFQFTVYVVNTWVVPNCANLSFLECSDAIVTAAPWRAVDPGLSVSGYVCVIGGGFLDVVNQSPTSGSSAAANDPITVNLMAAVVPNLVGLSTAAAIAAINAVCP